MRPIPISSLLQVTISIQLSTALPIQDLFYSSASIPDLIQESSFASVSTYVSDFLSTHKITIPQPKIEFFSLLNDYTSSTYDEAVVALNSLFDLIPDYYSSPELDEILAQEEESFEHEHCDKDDLEEPKLDFYNPEWEVENQLLEAMPEREQEPQIFGQTIRLSELKGRSDMVVIGIALLFLLTCITVEISKRWSHFRNSSKTHSQSGIYQGKKNVADSFNEKENLSSIVALPSYHSGDEKKKIHWTGDSFEA